MISTERIVPTTPLEEGRREDERKPVTEEQGNEHSTTHCSVMMTERQESNTIGSRQYPRTLTTQLAATPWLLMRLRTTYIDMHPRKLTP